MMLMLLFACTDPSAVDEQFFVRHDDADLRVRVQGDTTSNTLLLLVHGGPGGNAAEYNSGPYADALESRYAMAWWDQRGQGGSIGQYDPEEVTIQQLAEDGEAIVQFLKNEYGEDTDVYLFGHSWGGTLGTAMLLDTDVQPELAGWIEADGAHDIPLLNQEALRMFQDVGGRELEAGRNKQKWNEIVDFADSVDPDAVSLDEGGQINGYGQEAEGLVPEVVYGTEYGSLWEATLGSPVPLLPGSVSGMVTSSLLLEEVEAASYTDRLHEIEIPTLLLWGRYDFVVPPALGESADALIPDSELVIFEQSGHSPMDGEHEAFVLAIEDFIDG